MSTKETEKKIDRSNWAAGAWDGEPDRVEWRTAAGLPALIVRAEQGHLCGYVAVAPGHALHGLSYGDDAVDALAVHGGITYGDKCQGDVCHVPAPNEPDNVHWLGFDAEHGGDSSPRGETVGDWFGWSSHASYGEYRTVEFMRAECERLAAQLATVTS